MKSVLFCLLILLYCPGWAESSSPANTHLFRTTVIEEVEFEQMPLNEVITFLQDATRKGDQQVNFILPPETRASERRITLSLRNIKAVEVFATVLTVTGTRAEIRKNIVWILPDTAPRAGK